MYWLEVVLIFRFAFKSIWLRIGTFHEWEKEKNPYANGYRGLQPQMSLLL